MEEPASYSIKFHEYKSRIKIGGDAGMEISTDTRFNWFQKKMMKLFFGWEVTDLK